MTSARTYAIAAGVSQLVPRFRHGARYFRTRASKALSYNARQLRDADDNDLLETLLSESAGVPRAPTINPRCAFPASS